jgi:hypothetical protein
MALPFVNGTVLQAADLNLLTANGSSYAGTAGGTVDAITLTVSPAPASYAAIVGNQYQFKSSGANTISPTININGLGALATTMGSVALPAGGLISGNWYNAFVESATSIRVAPMDAASVNGDSLIGDYSVGGVLTVGSGATGSVLRPYTGGSSAAIYSANVTPANGNFAFTTTGNVTNLNGATDSQLMVNSTAIVHATSTGAAVTGTLSATKGVVTNVVTIADTGTAPVNADITDLYEITALAQALTFAAPTGTPLNGQGLMYRIKDVTAARALAFNAIFVPAGVALPTTTVLGKWMHLAFIYNTTLVKWQFIAVAQEA